MSRLIDLKENRLAILPNAPKASDLDAIRQLIQARKNTKRAPLTIDKIRAGAGLQKLSDAEAVEALDTIRKLSALLFEMCCHRERTCIDNQQVVCLTKQNKAA